MLDLNDPNDARMYVGEMIAAGFPILMEDQDYRSIPDDYALYLASRFFLGIFPSTLKGTPH